MREDASFPHVHNSCIGFRPHPGGRVYTRLEPIRSSRHDDDDRSGRRHVDLDGNEVGDDEHRNQHVESDDRLGSNNGDDG